MATSVRVHIGGLAPDVTAQELHERFGRVAASAQCQLAHVELPRSRLTPSLSKGFAYVTIVGAAAERVLEDITKAYHKTKWRGGVLRVALASPDYQARLQGEWDARDALQQAREEAVAAEQARMRPAETVAELRLETPFEGKRKTVFSDDDDVLLEQQYAADEEEEEEEEEEEKEAGQGQDEEEWTEEAIQALIAEKLAEEATDTESDSMGEEGDEERSEAEEEEEEDEAAEDSDASSSSSSAQTKGPMSATQPVLSVEEANARRLAALDEKKKKQQDAASKGFLGKIDVVGAASGKKITFDDDGEVAEIEDGRDGAAKEEQSQDAPAKRAAVVEWMGSDDDEEEEPKDGYGELDDEKLLRQAGTTAKKSLKTLEFDDGEEMDAEEDTEDQARFALRPEFLGETGKKLFEMQKRFGGDQRFRMDARFIEEEENEYFAHDGDDMDMLAPVLDDLDGEEEFLQTFQNEEDADRLEVYAQEMVRERDQALDVIAELFPDVDVDKIKYRLEALKDKDPIKEASWMGEQMRYDPRIAATTKYELTQDSQSRRAAKDEDEKLAEEEKRLAEEKRKREEKEVLIGGDRFYSASTSLGSLFSRVRKNSEDGEVGEAALDGVFSFSKPVDTKAEQGSAADAAPSAFKLSSLFDFSFGGDNEKKNELAMGENLLEAEDEEEAGDGAKMPWHFTQSFNENGGTGEDQPMRLAEDDGTDKEDDDGEHDEPEEADEDDAQKKKQKRVRVKRSLDDFLAFGRTFFGGTTLESLTTKEAKDDWQKQWAERRKKLTQDFKRKRRDALKQKKKQQQALQRHNAKRQKTASK